MQEKRWTTNIASESISVNPICCISVFCWTAKLLTKFCWLTVEHLFLFRKQTYSMPGATMELFNWALWSPADQQWCIYFYLANRHIQSKEMQPWMIHGILLSIRDHHYKNCNNNQTADQKQTGHYSVNAFICHWNNSNQSDKDCDQSTSQQTRGMSSLCQQNC